jgi:ADP-ribose pyrophosphatase
MPSQPFIEPSAFANIVRLTPLVSIDLILRDPDGAALVGLRTNEPAKGAWFVPGGRIGKDETLDEAFTRLMQVETGLTGARQAAKFLGVYEHFYDTNRLLIPGFGTHYVVLGYEVTLPARPAIQTDDQHSAIRWMSPTEILSDPDVHENTKAYFR